MSRWWERRRVRLEARSSTDPDESISPAWCNSRHTALRRQRLHGHAGANPVAGTNLSRRGGASIRNRSRTCRGQPHEGANPFVATIFRPAGVKARISTATAPKPRLFVGAIPTPGTIVPWLESVYTTASKSVARKGVWARIPPGRPFCGHGWNKYTRRFQKPLPERASGCDSRWPHQFVPTICAVHVAMKCLHLTPREKTNGSQGAIPVAPIAAVSAQNHSLLQLKRARSLGPQTKTTRYTWTAHTSFTSSILILQGSADLWSFLTPKD